MAWTLIAAYCAMALVTAVAVFIAGNRLGVERRPAVERLGLSLAAGVMWPVMLLGIAEVGSFAVYAKAHEEETAKRGIAVRA